MYKSVWAILIGIALTFVSCGTKRTTVLRHPGSGQQKTSNTAASSKEGKGTSTSGQAYIERYRDIAISEMNKYGIPASIKLAQALLESGNGNSYLAKEANNHFGIKCGGVWDGPSTRRADDGPNDCFRVYDNPDQSFKDHSQFLLRKRYEKLFSLAKDDYKGWAKGLKSAGYATNPRYAELLIDLIERYQLYQYDKAEKNYIAQVEREEKVEEIIEEKEVQEEVIPIQEVKNPVAMNIYEVKASDSLFGIGKQFGLSVDELKTLNGLDSENIYVGQLLVVSK